MDLPVVNHKDYFAKIGDDHKFPIKKFGELANYLTNKKIVKKFYTPYPCSVETLKRAHSESYINHVKNKTLDEKMKQNASTKVIEDWHTVLQYYVATQIDNKIPEKKILKVVDFDKENNNENKTKIKIKTF